MDAVPGETKRRYSTGRRDRVQQVSPEVEDLIKMVTSGRPPYIIGQYLSDLFNRKLDAELELLASHALQIEMDLKDPAVLTPIHRGQPHEALLQLQSRMRRKFAKMLRDHQRADDDLFTDQCIVED